MLLLGHEIVSEWQWVSRPFFHLSSCSHAATRLKLWSTCFEMLPLTSLKIIEEICDRKRMEWFWVHVKDCHVSVFDAVFASSLSSRLRYLHVFAVFAMKEMKWFSYHVKGCHASVFTVVFAVFAIFTSLLSSCLPCLCVVFISFQGLSCLCLRLSSRCPNLLPTSLTVDSAGSQRWQIGSKTMGTQLLPIALTSNGKWGRPGYLCTGTYALGTYALANCLE